MNELDLFTPVMTPAIALPILSTTMRAGNARLAIAEFSRKFQNATKNATTNANTFELLNLNQERL